MHTILRFFSFSASLSRFALPHRLRQGMNFPNNLPKKKPPTNLIKDGLTAASMLFYAWDK